MTNKQSDKGSEGPTFRMWLAQRAGEDNVVGDLAADTFSGSLLAEWPGEDVTSLYEYMIGYHRPGHRVMMAFVEAGLLYGDWEALQKLERDLYENYGVVIFEVLTEAYWEGKEFGKSNLVCSSEFLCRDELEKFSHDGD
jgi:hypothetical protein